MERQIDLKKKLCFQRVIKNLRAKEARGSFIIYPLSILFLFSVVKIIHKDL